MRAYVVIQVALVRQIGKSWSIYLRTRLLLPLDDLLAVIREFIEPGMSRSTLDRLLRRRGHSRLPVPDQSGNVNKPFKAYEPGYLRIDIKYLPQMADETALRYVFVAIDRATRWVFIHCDQAPQDGRYCPLVSQRGGQGHTVQDTDPADRQWQGVCRPPVWPTRQSGHW